MALSSRPQRKEKKQNYLHRKAPNKQKKNEKYFWSFSFSRKKQIKGENKNEKNYLHGKAPNKQKKNGKSFWVFFLITTTSMESKLAKSYN